MLWIKLTTLPKLGLFNIARVALYRLGVKAGINPVKKLPKAVVSGVFFTPPELRSPESRPAFTGWLGQQLYFGWFERLENTVPDWHSNCFTGQKLLQPDRPWWDIPDFDAGDIKTIWEGSRFDWVLAFMQSAVKGNEQDLDKLNQWLNDWCSANPCYFGPNWKCGQEASIRLMHLAMALLLAGQERTVTAPLQQLFAVHLERIAPTIHYAIAQDNNHATSEAAALYIGGSLLRQYGHPKADLWYNSGLKWLEERAARLILADGVFSQYSTTYHRVMLDTYCMAELWRQRVGLAEFSITLTQKLAQATLWLYQIVDLNSGDAPNLGSNDGARLLPLTDSSYRDFRPSIQLAAKLFLKKTAFQGSLAAAVLQWLHLDETEEHIQEQTSVHCKHGGMAVMRFASGMLLFRYPKFLFRPCQSDVLHIDLWVRGANVLRDGGTYSYNADPKLVSYFSGTRSHNTIEFDGRDQMPKLSRFLFGAWLKTDRLEAFSVNADCSSFAAGYTDWQGCKHFRRVWCFANKIRVEDHISGMKQQAVLRWRLLPGSWVHSGQSASFMNYCLTVSTDIANAEFELVNGLESRYYTETTELPVFEVRLPSAGVITTEFVF